MAGFINNEWDRDNLQFLLNIGDAELSEWHQQADADDLLYAQQLMAAYSLELQDRAKEIAIELALEDTNYHDANMVIDKFRR